MLQNAQKIQIGKSISILMIIAFILSFKWPRHNGQQGWQQ